MDNIILDLLCTLPLKLFCRYFERLLSGIIFKLQSANFLSLKPNILHPLNHL